MSEPIQFGTFDTVFIHEEKRDFVVIFATAEKILYRAGKTSFSPSYDPNNIQKVTEINAPDMNSADASTLIQILNSCQSDQVVRGIVAYGSQILVREEVLCSFPGWVNSEFMIWCSEGQKVKWFVHLNRDNKLFVYMRSYALGLLCLHKKRCYYYGRPLDLLITPEGLKMLLISYCPADADFRALELNDVNQFRLLFLSCLTYPLWYGKCKSPEDYQVIETHDQERLGLSWEVCQALNHLILATDLNSLPAEAFLNHPLFYTPKEKVIFSAKTNFELLYQNMVDGVIKRLNEEMRKKKDSWKVDLEIKNNNYILWIMGHCECSRMGILDQFESGTHWYSVPSSITDNHLFGDLCRLFFNAQRHLDKNAIDKPEPTPEDMLLFVEEHIPGGLVKIYGFLIYEFRKEICWARNRDIVEKRIKFLKNLV